MLTLRLLLLLVWSPLAAACVLPGRLASATPLERGTLEMIDSRCREGLALVAAGRGAEALPYLQGALARPELLGRDLTLPLAEAFHAAGAPPEVTLLAYEAAQLMPRPEGPESALIASRISALVHGLDDGVASRLLGAQPGRPSAPWLEARALEEASAASGAGTRGPVALLLPLSGKLEALGRRVLDGALAALEEGQVVWVADTAAEPAGSAVSRLARRGASAFLGPVDRASVAPAVEAAAARQVPVVRLDVEPATAPTPGVYRMGPSRTAELLACVTTARSRGGSRFVVLTGDHPYGLAVARAARAAIESSGLALVDVVSYPHGATDLATEAARVAGRRPDVVILGDAPQRGGAVARYLAAAGLVTAGTGRPGPQGEMRRVQLIAPSEWREAASLPEEDRRYLQGLWVGVEWDPARSPTVARAAERIARAVGHPATVLEAVGHDGLLLASRLSRDGVPELIDGGLISTRGFDKHGEPQRAARVYRLRSSGALFEPLP